MTQPPHIALSYGGDVHTLQLRRSLAPVALAATLLATLLVLFAWPQSAAAHDALVDSSPAAGSTVETLPDELTLTFSAALISGEGTTAVEVLDAEGNSVTDGAPTVDGAMVVQPLVAEAMAGEYTVFWQVLSSDGHPTDNTNEELTFTVTTSTLAETIEPSTEPTAEPSAESTMNPTDDATTTPTDEATETPAASDSDSATGWIWAGVVAGILVIAGIIAWLVARARRTSTDSGSDVPAER
ncbi:copper resistance CopC family protein [Microbacterium sp. A84]|uniref:copper resistance CopC family protein n=1 Tax=Microbacterium sp. A84 TaxID=3450715 RepID=UPI003F41CF13